MKTLIRGIVVAVLLAGLAGTASTVAAQRVAIDVRIGTPGYHFRHYGRGHRYYRQYHRPYVRHYRRPVIVVGPRAHYYRQPIVVRRSHRSPRSYYRYY